MKRVMLVLAVLILTRTVVFAGGSKQTAAPGVSQVRWSFWGAVDRITRIQQVVDLYHQETGNYVAAEGTPGTQDHFDKFRVQFAGGNAADIIQLGGFFSNLGVDDNGASCPPLADLLLPLDDYVKSGILDTKNIDVAAIKGGTRDGKLYAIPVGTNMPAMIYNKSLLERVGAPLPKVSMTWAEWEAWLAQVQAKLPAGVYAMTDNSATATGSVFFGYWAGQNGTPQYIGNKTTRMTAQAAQQYFDLWAKWRANGWVPPASVSADYAETNESTAAIIAGKTAVVQIWAGSITAYQSATRDELDLIELPNAAVSNGLWGSWNQMTGITKNTKNPEAAVKFLNFLFNEPRVWGFMATSWGITVTPAGRAAQPQDANTKKLNAYLDVAGKHVSDPNPNMPSDTEWNSGLHLIAQNVAYGRITSAQGGQQVMDLINRLINQ
jgi:multiple sugar transport system substrate-binding protein